jgi:hypothetical protein
MMFATDPRTLPARPPSEVEWEDLLVRVEIMPRALRVAIEDAPADAPDLLDILQAALGLEGELQLQLLAMVDGAPMLDAFGVAFPEGISTPDEYVAEYGRWRMRNFVMLQRRGINVWEWRVRGGRHDGATAYQLLLAAAVRDGEILAAVRETARGSSRA